MRPRKRFGQHFLHDQGVLQGMADAIRLKTGDRVLEIGPGQGALTDYLYADEGMHYLAVEIDRDLAPLLPRRYPNIHVINQDILRVDLNEVFSSKETVAGPPWRVVGNLPYNISSPLIIKLIDHVLAAPGTIADMHFMLQKEMASRLSALPGTKAWGRLSVMIQVTARVDYLFDVGPESFSPPPKVDSSVIRMTPLADAHLPVARQALDLVLRMAFSARRKRLSNALKNLAINWQEVDVDAGLRADDVTVEQFIQLAQWTSANPVNI
ncbi:MAG: 16S rRNA (adenine1518-N6/adenine1519-N6)-dimethyltransferase [Candidatus Azotimanducaceae bacterium]|jgi:16S rRNA (adenine1518-N6/adenine1519-N6)-dimethyltransferase|tara:strand:- start:9564 stop:10364 length:801 start_codon:yes stop_codon:yes gene_type:complete